MFVDIINIVKKSSSRVLLDFVILHLMSLFILNGPLLRIYTVFTGWILLQVFYRSFQTVCLVENMSSCLRHFIIYRWMGKGEIKLLMFILFAKREGEWCSTVLPVHLSIAAKNHVCVARIYLVYLIYVCLQRLAGFFNLVKYLTPWPW